MDEEKNRRDYKKELNRKNLHASIIFGMARMFEALREESLIEWVEENPEYWEVLTEMDSKDITPKLAEEVMISLKASHIIELQIVWIFRCGDLLDIYGRPAKDE